MKQQMAQVRPPVFTCEAVIAEGFHLLRRLGEARLAIVGMLRTKLLAIRFRLDENADALSACCDAIETCPCRLRMPAWCA